MATAFFEPVSDDRFLATELTRGPWDINAQHAGPPAALLGRAIERMAGARDDMRIARITYDIVKPVPITELTVETRMVRAGRSVELIEASLAPSGGATVMRASALRIRVVTDSVPSILDGGPPPDPETLVDRPFPVAYDAGYHTAMQLRYVRGSFPEPGPATCWFRMRYPLVAGEETAPLSRVLIAADSGNGISNVLPPGTHVFVNPELTVHLHRYPVGEWVCLDARTTVDASGIGLAATALLDTTGPIGRGTQSLLVTARP